MCGWLLLALNGLRAEVDRANKLALLSTKQRASTNSGLRLQAACMVSSTAFLLLIIGQSHRLTHVRTQIPAAAGAKTTTGYFK